MRLLYAIVNFYLFYNGAVDLTRSQCTVSDTQVSVKAHVPLVFFLKQNFFLFLNFRVCEINVHKVPVDVAAARHTVLLW